MLGLSARGDDFKYLHERGEDPRGVASPVWKRKGNVLDHGKYRGITLLSHVLKVLEKIMDGRTKRMWKCEMG